MNKISEDLGQIIEKAGGGRQVGSTKTDKQGRTLVWTETKPGKYDWRLAKNQSSKDDDEDNTDGNTFSKLQQHLKNSTVDDLRKFAKKPGNAPKLRQAAYDELVERGDR
jgi:hypothetical protein